MLFKPVTLLPLLAGLLLVQSGHVAAAEPRLYDVEVIVFTQHGSEDGERMVQPNADGVQASGAFPENQFTELSQSNYTLNRIRDGLSPRAGYSVLFHRAWRQLAYDRNHAVDYPVHSIAVNARDSIDGTVTLIRERYLHLDIDLLLMQAENSTAVTYSDGPGNVPVYRLNESRRVRSSEIHYFDHPRIGVIARVTPYNTPEQPAAAESPEDALPAEQLPPASEEEPLPDAPVLPR